MCKSCPLPIGATKVADTFNPCPCPCTVEDSNIYATEIEIVVECYNCNHSVKRVTRSPELEAFNSRVGVPREKILAAFQLNAWEGRHV